MPHPNVIAPSFDYFESIFKNAVQNCVLLMDMKGTVTAINKAFTNCFGYSENDIIGRSASILFTEEDLKKGLFERELSNVLSKGQASDTNYMVNKDQSITWVSGESVRVKNKQGDRSILKLIQNIHDLKTSENELRQLNSFNERILASIKDVVLVIDDKMKIVTANNAYTDLFNKNESKSPPLDFYNLIKPYDAENHLLDDLQKTFITKQGFTNKHVEINLPAGYKRFFEVTCTPIPESVNNEVLLVTHDVTIYKEMESEREDILGFVAHELRNPLSNVILCNEIMGQSLKDNNLSGINKMLERSNNNVMRLNKMISELYEATKINSGYLNLEMTEFKFEDMVNEAIDTTKVMQPAYNIIVNGNGNITVRADRYKMIQVITNYLGNGIKYSNGKHHVALTISHDNHSLTVSVKDEGLGISKEQLPFIFERFFRAEKTRNIEGIGMGLYLCRQIIKAHKGEVWAESEEGKGSTFYFSLPLNMS